MKLFIRVVAVVVAILLLAAAAAVYLLYSPEPPEPTSGDRPVMETVQVGDRTRRYLVYAPARVQPAPALLVVFHGSMGTAEGARADSGYSFDRLADRHGFVVAYPQGFGGNWNGCQRNAPYRARQRNIDDVGFFRAIVARLAYERKIDPSRVFIVGVSNGGQMVFRLALEQPRAIAGAAAFAANLPTPANSVCRPSGEPVSIMLVNGTDDPISPYAGGVVSLFGFASRGEALSAPASARYFAALAGAPPASGARVNPMRREDPTWVERQSWTSGGKAEVVLISVHGGGHVLPYPGNRPRRLLGRSTSAIDGPAEAWAFFSRRTTADAGS